MASMNVAAMPWENRRGAGAAVQWWKLFPGGDEAVVAKPVEGIQRGYKHVPPQECR